MSLRENYPACKGCCDSESSLLETDGVFSHQKVILTKDLGRTRELFGPSNGDGNFVSSSRGLKQPQNFSAEK